MSLSARKSTDMAAGRAVFLFLALGFQGSSQDRAIYLKMSRVLLG